MPRLFLRLTLASVLLAASASLAMAQDCAHCRGGLSRSALRGNTMGSVAYGDGAGYGAAYGGAVACQPHTYPTPDLFYNFYANGPCSAYPAAMYVAPKPVPPHVGHTYITYQPLMPHEFMYKHHRTYHQYYDSGRGLTRAKVIWW